MPANKKSVLCVDDNPDDRELIKTYLGWEDIEVTIADAFAEGLARAKSDCYDLYLIEASLPDGSGVDLTRQLREFDSMTPIIFHTDHCSSSTVVSAMSAGAQRYLQKQGDVDFVVRTIKFFLGTEWRYIGKSRDGQ
jgi:DNA-binding response OmpR family regulator